MAGTSSPRVQLMRGKVLPLARFLRQQALVLLTRREHSRRELATKLLRAALAELQARAAPEAPNQAAARHLSQAAHGPDEGSTVSGLASSDMPSRGAHLRRHIERVPPEDVPDDLPEVIDAVLDGLQREGWLDEARLAEARVHARQARHGGRRIARELNQRGVALPDALAKSLAETEWSRAQALWQQRFPQPAVDERERARRVRFMLRRGFDAGLIQRLERQGR